MQRIDEIADSKWIAGNTVKKLKVLNKTIKKGKWYQTAEEKEIYNLKKEVITDYVKDKWIIIQDKWRANTTVKIKQGKTKAEWHLDGDLYSDLKKEWIIKKKRQ